MKIFKFLIILFLFTCSLAAMASANAGSKEYNRENNKSGNNANNNDDGGVPAPINRQILFLIITGVAICCKLIADKRIVKNRQTSSQSLKKVNQQKHSVEIGMNISKSKFTPVRNL